MVSRSNQDGKSKLNTDPQLAETIIVDRSSRELTQNEVNQKELPQLKKCFSSFIKIETKTDQKALENKIIKSVKAEVI